MEMTTAEIFKDMKGTDAPADLLEELKELFERADFVKFAKFTASDEDNAKALPVAVRFVTSTYQSDLEEMPDQAGHDADAVQSGNDDTVMSGNASTAMSGDNDAVMSTSDKAGTSDVGV